MRRLLAALALTTTLTGGAASADTVIELYTSQGCSSCPPADAMLAQLATRGDVIPLALHVDYWDYLGWKDDLASPAFTRRQKGFAEAAGSATVYTPQMVIGGVDHVIGSRPMQVMDAIQAHNAAADRVSVTLSRSGDRLQINATGRGALPREAVVQVVRYVPAVTRDIKRGENAGKTITYTNTVTSWQVAGRWNPQQPLSMQAQVTGAEPVVVIIQDGTSGPILGAARLR
ncbi:DUF1223 domain-containing protein [Yoonia sp. R2331]|uniref:DUF1223 domain-containing protein n=1 Tax=Yoonia sp. R2331 TaxID=3237238 RepID=UPI0034E47909